MHAQGEEYVSQMSSSRRPFNSLGGWCGGRKTSSSTAESSTAERSTSQDNLYDH
ncbi:hypothetical protein C0J52_24660 [Blattella germanica]|nr:hypothetical protein C0J52_24660 [Blattella germanica]